MRAFQNTQKTDTALLLPDAHPSSEVRIRSKVTIPIRILGGMPVSANFYTFEGLRNRMEHIAIALGKLDSQRTPLVRLHSECLTGEAFGSQRCDCGQQLQEGLARIDSAGGYLIYLRQEGRGIGLYNKLSSYVLQDEGLNTFEANRRLGFKDDHRTYDEAAKMLLALGVSRVKLLSNNPQKIEELDRNGVFVEQRIPTLVYATPENQAYLKAKEHFTKHDIALSDLD